MDPINQTPNAPRNPQVRPAGEGSVGPVVGTIIVLAVIVLGGLYFWHEHSNATPAYTTPAVSTTTDDTNSSSTTNVNVDTGIQYQGS